MSQTICKDLFVVTPAEEKKNILLNKFFQPRSVYAGLHLGRKMC